MQARRDPAVPDVEEWYDEEVGAWRYEFHGNPEFADLLCRLSESEPSASTGEFLLRGLRLAVEQNREDDARHRRDLRKGESVAAAVRRFVLRESRRLRIV